MLQETPAIPASTRASAFVAVGHHGLRLMSIDGVEWTNPTTGKEGQVYRAVSFGNGRFASVGSFGGTNIFASTGDGANWDLQSKDAKYVNYLRGLGFGNGLFVGLGGDPGAVGDSRPFVMTSTDGISWSEPVPNVVTQSLLAEGIPKETSTKPPPSSKNMLRRIAYGNERFVAVGDRGRRSVTKDGKEWTDTPDVKAIDTLIDVAFGNGVFVGVGLHGLRMRSEDGILWSERLMGEEGEHINSVVWTDDRFVAVAQGATYTSRNGFDWDRTPNTNAPLIAVFGLNKFVGSNWRGRLLHSTDAIEWKVAFHAEHHIEAVAFG